MDDLEIFRTKEGKVFAIKNIRVKQISSTKLSILADMAGDIPGAQKYLDEKVKLMEKMLQENLDNLK